jgi:type II secretory pathway pseudopilin PulG
MKKTGHGLWSGAAVTVVSMAVVFGAVTLTPKVSAMESMENHHHTPGMDMSKYEQSSTTATTNTAEQSAATEARRTAEQAAKERRAAAEQALKDRKAAAKEKLSEAKLKICEKRQANINDRSTKIAERAAKHLAVFDKIAERVQTFYINKGNTLDTYDSLVSEVDAKRTAAQTTINTLAAVKSSFNCNSAEPKLAVEGFKTAMAEAQTALNEYRAAIKDLIVGVKSVNSTNDKTAEETR